MKQKYKQCSRNLYIALLILAAALIATTRFSQKEPTKYYEIQIDARERMELCIQKINQYREQQGISLSPEDIHKTGLIGADFSVITTSQGNLSSKRTTANPDMAALVVRMFQEAGLDEGDHVGAGFSGSFPGLNLAVLCACDAMELNLTYISSIGASNYGANIPELTFPDIAHKLYVDGLISTDSILVTPGGDFDNGKGVFDESAFTPIITRITGYGLPVLREENYQVNLDIRKSLYDSQEIDCFVSVGGNITSIGIGDSALSLGQGLLTRSRYHSRLSNESGLVEWYLTQGIPVIHLLNIKKIVTDYNMPFDPPELLIAGESPVYHTINYPKIPIILSLLMVFWLIYITPKK